MTKQDIQFQIDQLRKDKMIYAIESCATTAIAVLLIGGIMMFGTEMIGWEIAREIGVGICLVAVGYFVFMVVGNFKRLQKIKKLEREL